MYILGAYKSMRIPKTTQLYCPFQLTVLAGVTIHISQGTSKAVLFLCMPNNLATVVIMHHELSGRIEMPSAALPLAPDFLD